jgi:UDP-3-O-[3-hydroxymyristoyl] glucosamine N-acyltransferase
MRKNIKEIAELIGAKILGDSSLIITGVSGIEEAREGEITFLANNKYLPYLEKTGASAVITSGEISTSKKTLLQVDNPSLAFTKVVSLVAPSKMNHPKGIDTTAVIGKQVRLGKDVAIGPYTVIADNVSIGDKTIIYAGCYIGESAQIGSNTLIHAHVSIREQVSIGNNVIIQDGTVIGSDGFGFVTVDGIHHRIPQVGTVVIEDDVEIGSNVSIDRARFDKTIIGRGTKIDNLVHIAHNVIIGKNCFIVAQVGISGSSSIGDNVILAGQVGLVGHIRIGDNSIVMAQSGVSKSVPDNTTMWGYPAKPAEVAKKVNACVQNLPRLYETINALKKKIIELESKLKKE